MENAILHTPNETLFTQLPSITNNIILITGCSSGIGLHAAMGLKKLGYRVFATARNLADVDKLKSNGLESEQLDLCDSNSIKNALDNILIKTHGKIDVLFNNAAFGLVGAVEDLSRDAIRAQFETNLFGTLELTNLVIPIMRKQGQGRIIQNSSVLGLVVLPYRGAYNASKFALEAITDTLRLELQDTGIKVSLIEPGPIESKFRANAHKAFRQYINPEQSSHKGIYKAMIDRLTKPGPVAPFTLTPEAVLIKLVDAIDSPKPKIRYYVTFPTYLFASLKRILTFKALDRFLLRISRDENQTK